MALSVSVAKEFNKDLNDNSSELVKIIQDGAKEELRKEVIEWAEKNSIFHLMKDDTTERTINMNSFINFLKK